MARVQERRLLARLAKSNPLLQLEAAFEKCGLWPFPPLTACEAQGQSVSLCTFVFPPLVLPLFCCCHIIYERKRIDVPISTVMIY